MIEGGLQNDLTLQCAYVDKVASATFAQFVQSHVRISISIPR